MNNQFSLARWGMFLVVVGSLAWMLALGGGFVALTMGSLWLMGVLAASGAVLLIVGPLFSMIGKGLCMTIEDGKARGLVGGSLVCDLTGFGLGFAGSSLAGIAPFIGLLLFLAFLGRACVLMERDDLQKFERITAYTGLGAFLSAIATPFLLFSVGGGFAMVPLILGVGFVVFYHAYIIRVGLGMHQACAG